jgi:hypothetical protein
MPPKKPVFSLKPAVFSFKPGHYKTINPQDYTSIVLAPLDIQLDLAKLRAHPATAGALKQGMRVQAMYTQSGKYAGQWYACRLVRPFPNGWIVAWADKDTRNTRKHIEHIRHVTQFIE